MSSCTNSAKVDWTRYHSYDGSGFPLADSAYKCRLPLGVTKNRFKDRETTANQAS